MKRKRLLVSQGFTQKESPAGRDPVLQAGCHWFESSTAHTV
ncbi:hypothetical protein ABN584_12240 [Gloeocapsa sp. BRSZ]